MNINHQISAHKDEKLSLPLPFGSHAPVERLDVCEIPYSIDTPPLIPAYYRASSGCSIRTKRGKTPHLSSIWVSILM